MNQLTQKAIESFKRKGFFVNFFEKPEEALDFIISKIGSSDLGIGGSMTIDELGWADKLAARGKLFWHMKAKPEGILEMENAAPAYITSVNAASADGALVNIDGNGNRVCATSYGVGKKVFFVFGENKIEGDISSALFRAKNIAAPLNARRLNKKTPCAIKADKCYNCNSPDRICRVTSIITYPVNKMEMYIIILSGKYGY